METKSSFTAEFRIKAILDEAEQELKKFSTSAKSIWQSQEPPKSLSKALEQLEAKLISLRQLSEKGRVDSSDVAQAEADYRLFQKTLRGVGIDFKLFTQEQKKAMLGKEEAANIEKRREAIEKYSRALAKNAELTKKRAPIESEITQKKATIKNKEAANTKKAKKRDSIEAGKPIMPPDAEQYLRNLERQKQLQQELAGLERELVKRRNAGQVAKAGGNYARQLERQAELQRELASIDLTTGVTEYQDYTTAIATADAQIEKLNQEIKDNETAISTAGDEIEALERQLKRLELVDENVALTELKTALTEAGVAGADTATSFDELKQKINELDAQALAQVEERIKVATAGMEELGNSMKRTETELDKTTKSLQAQNEALNAQQAFANRISQFVGLEGAAQLARRALRDAFSTITELDKAMTEMAVVTDLGVGDYWDQLPEYTTRANALGVSIKSAYESATLFYQQGLKTNEVMAISNETLKMARIAGLSAENATNKMTAALRGFNMELNETSAQRIADVYSELAAITASDVNEISSAMTKTASIAASAGMEFETTAAFLSQIIETTRESAETAGTALKTVIARFQELKKDASEIGEVDGEVVDANKIETALRSVGVALRDSNGQFRELDDVFLELSSKWSSLDTNTQRYIATIAAGSRQQSRFIAMMSDYSRTQELVSAANNSAGASAEQFAKTAESLESKLNRLQNAWDTFSMGLINHKLVKGGVDFLTKLITLLDKTSNSLGAFGGILSKIGLTLTVFKAGKIILDKFVISIQEKFREAGYKAGQAFKQGMEGEVFQSKDITDSKDSSNEKTKFFFGKTRKNYKNAISTLGQASQDLDASRRLNKEAREESKIGKKQKSTGQEQIDSGVLKIGEEFRTKMSQITGDTEKAKDAWKKYEQELKKGSQEAKKAIENMNSELQQASSKKPKRSKRSVQAKNRKASKGQKSQNQKKAQTDKIEKQDLTQLDKQNKGIKELTEGHKNLTEATEHNENATRKKTEAERLGQEANKKSQKGMTDLGKAMNTVSQTTIGIGVGITALSGLMERLGLVSEEDSAKVADFGAIVALAGSAMMSLPPIIRFLGLTFSKTGAQIAAAGHTAQSGWILVSLILTAVIALIVLIAKLFSSEKSPQEKLKEAEEAAQAAAEAANQAKEAFEDLQSSFDKYKEIKDTLGSLEEGTLEWRKAMLELNSEVMELLTLYPQLASYVRIGENGVLEIDDVGMEEMLNLAYQRAQTASIASAFATIQAKEQAKANAEESETANTLKTYRKKGGVTDSGFKNEEQRLTALDNKLKDNTFDASFEFIKAEDYDKLTEEQLRRLYDSTQNTWGYSETFDTKKEDIINYLNKEYSDGITLYSKDVFDYASANFIAMEKIAKAAGDAMDLAQAVNDTNLEIQTAIKSAVVGSLSTTTGDYTQMLSKVYSDLFESNEIDFNQKIEEREKENKGKLWANDNSDTKTELEDKLIDLGFTPSGDEVKDMATYYKALTGVEYDYSTGGNEHDDDLAELIARAEVAKEFTEEMNKAVEIADSNPILSDLLKGDLDVNLGAAADEINSLFPDSSTDELSADVKDNFEGAIKVIEQERKAIGEKMKEIFKEDFFGEDNAKNISYKVADQFIKTYNLIASYANESTARLFADAVEPILNKTSLSAEEIQLKMDEFLNVKWDSAIEGAATLNKWLESDNEQLKVFAANMLLVENKLYSATSQMNEFYKSMSSETLEKLAEDGKISATEILELAKSNEQLATMMDTTKISAATLGKYYDLIKKKTLKAIEATDGFVSALDKLNAASNAIENSFAFIDTFEPSRSQTEIGGYFSEMRETVMGLYNQGAYGDEQLTDYIKAFLGEDNWSTILEENNNNLKTAIDQAISQINIYGDNLYQVWKSFAENEDFEGVTLGEDGIIEFDLNIIGTTDNLKKKIMDMGWSETMAEALVADAQTFSSNLEKELKSVDIESALKTWLANAFKMDEKTLIPKSQVVAMAKELGLEVQQVTTILKANGIETIDFFTSEGGLSAKLKEKFQDTMKGMGDGDKAIDFEAGYEMLLELGLDDAAAKKELKILAGSLENVKFSIGDENYEQTEEKFKQGEKEIAKYTIDAQIDAMEDPKVKRARQKQTQEQAKMLSKALIIAQTIATQSMMKITTKAVDAMINSMAKELGLNITSSIAQDFEDNFELDSTIKEALEGAEDVFALEGEAAGQVFENNLLEYVEATEEEVKGIAGKLAEKVEDSKSGTGTAYTTDDSQTVKTDSSETETWENPYDEIYNLNKKINAVIRERERLERNYERALNDSSKTAQELADITAGELKALKEEAILQKNTAEVARQYISYRQKDNARFSKYYTYDSETNVIQVDWEAVGKSGWDSDTSDEFKEFISYLEEQVDIIQDAEDSLEDIQDSVDDIENRGRDATSKIYDQVKEGLIKERQNQIDELQNINDSIQEAQSALVEQMQKQIDEARQARENDKTEEDIADKRTRLAYLQQDTSGAKALEIMALEKEIREAEEGYTDSLVDQALQKLQDANEKAAEQRQRQIDLAQLALNEYEESGKVWTDVKKLVDEGFADVADGVPFVETEAGKLALISDGINGLNPINKEDFYDELDRNAREGAIHQGFVSVTGEGKEGKTIAQLAKEVTSAIETNMDFGKIKPPIVNVTVNTGNGVNPEGPEGSQNDEVENVEAPRMEIVPLDYTRFHELYDDRDNSKLNLKAEELGIDSYDVYLHRLAEVQNVELPRSNYLKLLRETGTDYYDYTRFHELYDGLDNLYFNSEAKKLGIDSYDVYLKKLVEKQVLKFKTGGLADFTGPAWLDGTKSRPELVLNQTDTANFIALKDILAEIFDNPNSLSKGNSKSGGDNYYDIEISVEKIGDDYDVDRLADRIKEIIYEDSVYRNVNAVNFMR